MSYRDTEKARIDKRIHDIHVTKADTKKTIEKYNFQQVNRNYFDNQVKKLTHQLTELDTELGGLQDRLIILASGKLDLVLEEQSKALSKKIQDQEKLTKEKKAKQDNLMKQRGNTASTHGGKFQNDPDRSSYVNYAKEYAYFEKICASIPDYMLKNLETMPSNKGYTWRGCWCFGDNPPEKGEPTLVFEKIKSDDLMIIHEMTESHYNIYHKYGKDKKQLISSIPKKMYKLAK
jgi:hypothetical protein